MPTLCHILSWALSHRPFSPHLNLKEETSIAMAYMTEILRIQEAVTLDQRHKGSKWQSRLPGGTRDPFLLCSQHQLLPSLRAFKTLHCLSLSLHYPECSYRSTTSSALLIPEVSTDWHGRGDTYEIAYRGKEEKWKCPGRCISTQCHPS